MLKTSQVATENVLNERAKNDLISTKFEITLGKKLWIVIIIKVK